MPELSERIRSYYDSAVEPITVEEITTSGDPVLSVAPEQNRRLGRVLAAAAVVAVLAVAAVVVYRLFDSGAEDPTEVEVIDEPDVDEASPDESDSPPEVVYVEAEGQRVAMPESWTDPYFDVMAWHDGFLAIVPIQPAFAFPELTDEQSALFSQELRDLFADNPPETVDEAAQRVADAGLYGELEEVVEAYPELYELLVGNRAEGWVEAWTSVDGMEWELVGNFNPPIQGPSSVTTTDGERLVVATDSTVSVTTDLLEWETLPLPEYTPAVPSDAVTASAHTVEFSTGADRWVLATEYLSVLDPTVVDIAALIPDADEYHQGGDAKWEVTSRGVVYRSIEDFFDDGNSYSWYQLGIDPETAEQYQAEPIPSRILTATWGDTPVVYDAPDQKIISVAVTDEGALALAEGEKRAPEILFSADGTEWSTVTPSSFDLPTAFGWRDLRLLQIQDGVLLTTAKGTYVGNADGSRWTPLDIMDLDPEDVLADLTGNQTQFSPGVVHFTDLADYDGPDVYPLTHVPEWAMIATVDGTNWFVVEIDDEPSEYGLTATATINGDRLLVHVEADAHSLQVYELD